MSKIVGKKESEILEWKTSVSEIKEIIQTVSAFSNKKGGKILVGVSDSGKVIGINIGKGTIEKLANDIVNNTDPKVYPGVKEESILGKSIILMEVERSMGRLVSAYGRPYKRVGKSNHRMSTSEQEKAILENNKYKLQYDNQICKESTIKDLDGKKIKMFLEKAKAGRNYDVNINTPVKEAMEKLNLLHKGKLLNTAILLFGKNPQKYIPQAKIRCARFKGVENLDFIDMKVFDGTISELQEEAMKFIALHTKHGVFFDANRRYDKWEYPLRALEEILVNALVHRDYFSNSDIYLSIYDDRIEVWNPGELSPLLALKDLKKKHKSILRNKLLAEKLFLAKYIEQWGTGTIRVIKEMKEHGLAEPIFENNSGGFEVTLTGPGKSFEEKIEKEKLHILDINERQKKAIVYIKKNGSINRSEYMKINKISHKTAHLELKQMVTKKLFIQEGKGRSTKYLLKR